MEHNTYGDSTHESLSKMILTEENMLRILHTSDWHLGRSLLTKRRHAEHKAFLEWLICFITEQQITVLLVSGDIFDTATPGNAAQQLYYDFLTKLGDTPCRHVVITAGNHDSPSFLGASKGILARCGVHVVGATPHAEETVFKLDSPQEEGGSLIVCAIPFLRERELLKSLPGEAFEEKEQRFLEGITRYYADAAAKAEELRQRLGDDTPLIMLGHLFTANGTIEEGDGVRTLNIGSLQGIPASIFPDTADYIALGHLHSAQKVAGNEHIRYSGSPFPMSFNESGRQKKVCLLMAEGRHIQVEEVEVPCFQRLSRVQGTLDVITEHLTMLMAEGESIWVEVEYTGAELIGNLRDKLYGLVEGSALEILRIKDRRMMDEVRKLQIPSMDLEEMTVDTVFQQFLEEKQIPEEQHANLTQLYDSILHALYQEGEAEVEPKVEPKAGPEAGQGAGREAGLGTDREAGLGVEPRVEPGATPEEDQRVGQRTQQGLGQGDDI